MKISAEKFHRVNEWLSFLTQIIDCLLLSKVNLKIDFASRRMLGGKTLRLHGQPDIEFSKMQTKLNPHYRSSSRVLCRV